MIARLAQLHERLEGGLDRMLTELAEMTEAQRRFRPAEDSWSPTEVAHHLLLVQAGIVGAVEKMHRQPAKRRSLMDGLKHLAVKGVLFCGIRVRNPVPAAAPDPAVSFEDLEPQWATERQRTLRLFESLDAEALGQAGFKHPIAGPLSVEDSLVFLVGHLEHHHRQLDRIRSHARYPD